MMFLAGTEPVSSNAHPNVLVAALVVPPTTRTRSITVGRNHRDTRSGYGQDATTITTANAVAAAGGEDEDAICVVGSYGRVIQAGCQQPEAIVIVIVASTAAQAQAHPLAQTQTHAFSTNNNGERRRHCRGGDDKYGNDDDGNVPAAGIGQTNEEDVVEDDENNKVADATITGAIVVIHNKGTRLCERRLCLCSTRRTK